MNANPFDNNKGIRIKNLVRRFEGYLRDESPEYFLESELERILQFYEDKGYYTKALRAIDLGIDQYAFSGFFLYKKAEIIFDLERDHHFNFEFLMEMIDQSLALDPGDFGSHLLRAEVLFYKGDVRGAENGLKDALRFATGDKDRAEAFRRMAELCEELDKGKEYYQYMESAILEDPDNEDLYFDVEGYSYDNEDFSEAIEIFLRIIDKKPYSFYAWLYLGKAFRETGLLEKALEAFEYAEVIREDVSHVKYTIGEVYAELGNYSRASEMILEAMDIKGDASPEDYLLLGKNYQEAGDLSTSKKWLQKALTLKQNYPEANFFLAKILNAETKYSEAVNLLISANKNDPKNIEYVKEWYRLTRENADPENAIQPLKALMELDKNNFDFYNELSDLYYQLGDYDNCRKVAREAVEVFGDDQSRCLLASTLIITGKRKEGLLMFEELCQQENFDISLIFKLNNDLLKNENLLNFIEKFNS